MRSVVERLSLWREDTHHHSRYTVSDWEPLTFNPEIEVARNQALASRGLRCRFVQNLSDISEMSIKHNCEMATFPVTDVM